MGLRDLLGMILLMDVLGMIPPSSRRHGQTGVFQSLDWALASTNYYSSCPWVTNVGATKVYPGNTVWDPESAVVDPVGEPYSIAFSSGGGFSNIYPQPDYQKAAVASFFESYNPPYPYYEGNSSFGANGGVYNRIGRG